MRTFTSLLVLLPAALLAQPGTPDSLQQITLTRLWSRPGTHYFSTTDSLEFTAFMSAYMAASSQPTTSHPDEEYHLVWHEKREGFGGIVTRGDGRPLSSFLGVIPQPTLFHSGGASYRGDRYAVISDDRPMGTVSYDHWYFERVEP